MGTGLYDALGPLPDHFVDSDRCILHSLCTCPLVSFVSFVSFVLVRVGSCPF